MIIVVMGVAGSGKTTVGTMLADAMKCPFLEGDALHSPGNIDKMSHGIPLTDADRGPWLSAIHARIVDCLRARPGPRRRLLGAQARVPEGARRRRPDNVGVFERLVGAHSFAR